MAFQPSKHSYRSAVISMPTAQQLGGYGFIGGGLLAQLASVVGSDSGTPAAPSAAGYYTEGGYVYLYLPENGSLTIVVSPRSQKSTAVAQGSSAYTAIVNQIKSGVARKISADEVNAVRAEYAPKTSTFVAPAGSPPPDLTSATGESTPFYKHPFFLPIAISGTALILGTIFILTRE